MKNILLGAGAALILASGAHASVVESGSNGFSIQETAHIQATPEQVYDALVHPAKWWNAEHTYSKSAANLTMDARGGGCFCETWSGGSVQHAIVVDAEPGKTLRLRGPLGPFQGQGVDGALTFTLKAADGGTELTLDDNIGGYMKGGFGKWPQAADAMLNDLVNHLKTYTETRSSQ